MKYGQIVRAKQDSPTDYQVGPLSKDGIGVWAGGGYVLTPHGAKHVDEHCIEPVAESRQARREIAQGIRHNIQTNQCRGRKWIMTGSDPECFTIDKETGVIIPAYQFLPKKEEVAGKHSIPYWDGFQSEWTIPPDNCHSYVVDTVQTGIKNTLAKAKVFNPNAQLTWKPVLEVPNNIREAAAKEHVALGCAPSRNGYRNSRAELEGVEGRALSIRFAGFHIHLGTGKVTMGLARHIVQQIDRVVAVLFVAVLDGMDDPVRRKFYGLAGEFRLPTHGIEYRVLSSAVLAHPALVHLAFDMVRLTAMYAIGGVSLIDEKNDIIRGCINNCDVPLARKLVEKNKDFYGSAFKALYDYTYCRGGQNKPLTIIEKGAKELLPITSMEDNWKLNGGWVNHSDGTNENFGHVNFLNVA